MTLEELSIDYQSLHLTEALILKTLKHIDGVGPHPGQPNWDAYWGSTLAATEPSYLERGTLFRYGGKFVIAAADAELRFFKALKDRYFRKYFGGVGAVAEFGCGTGANLGQVGDIFGPQVRRYGFDWAPAAVKLASQHGVAAVFDMLRPQCGDPGDRHGIYGEDALGILTSGSMEQLGTDFEPFLDFLVGLKAMVYLHIEPLVELYDPANLLDYLAIAYHKKRGYLGNFLAALTTRGCDVVEIARTGFGNRWNEGYSIVVWTGAANEHAVRNQSVPGLSTLPLLPGQGRTRHLST